MIMIIKKHIGEYRKQGKQYVALCPFHDDKKPSFFFTEDDLFYCFGCGISGNGKKFLELMGITDEEYREQIRVYSDDSIKILHRIDKKYIKQFKLNLWHNTDAFFYLVSRGIKPFVIKDYDIGWDYYHKYYTIPIYDEVGVMNIKLHNSHRDPKSLWYFKDRQTKLLFPLSSLRSDTVCICEGEMDCLLLLSNGINAVTSTCGCSYFNESWVKLFKNKNVFILYDNDEAGKNGAEKVHMILQDFTRVQILTVPKYEGVKDVTDLYIKKRKEFYKLIKEIK